MEAIPTWRRVVRAIDVRSDPVGELVTTDFAGCGVFTGVISDIPAPPDVGRGRILSAICASDYLIG